MPPRKNPQPRYRLKENLARKFREEGHGSRRRFAKEYDVPPSTVGNWTDPASNMLPNGEQLCDLADFFNTTPDELVHGEPRPEVKEDQQILRIKGMLYELPREDLDHIEGIVKRLATQTGDKPAEAEGG